MQIYKMATAITIGIEHGGIEANKKNYGGGTNSKKMDKVDPLEPDMDDMDDDFLSNLTCRFCQKRFSSEKSVRLHLRKIHKQTLPKRKSESTCAICYKVFSKKFSLTRHLQNVHKMKVPRVETTKSRLKCPITSCNTTCKLYSLLRSHLTNDHNTTLEYEEREFPNTQEFLEWKKTYEMETKTSYVLDSAPRTSEDGIKKQYFVCHRSYSYRRSGDGKKRLKRVGSNKMGAACPSTMTVTTIEAEVYVQLYKTHVGHTCELDRMFLPKDDRIQIADKLKDGLSLQDVLDDIRQSAGESEPTQRIHLVDRRDLYNIVRDFSLTDLLKNREKDAKKKKVALLNKWEDVLEALKKEQLSIRQLNEVNKHLDEITTVIKFKGKEK